MRPTSSSAIGTDFDGVMTQNWMMPQPPRLVCVNVDAADATKNYAADVVLVGDAREVTEQLVCRGAATSPDRRRRWRGSSASAPRWRPPSRPTTPTRRRSWRSWRARCRRTRWWWPTCASPATGWPATAACRARAPSPTRWGGARWASRSPPRWAPPSPDRRCACAETEAFSSPAASWRPSPRPRSRSRWCWWTTAATACCASIRNWPATSRSAWTSVARTSRRSDGRSASRLTTVDGFGPAFETALSGAVASLAPSLIVVRARLKPPPTTSPRWYRRPRG